jgi:CO/xanthine dehydrogenase Mo-binding subunit
MTTTIATLVRSATGKRLRNTPRTVERLLASL